MKVEAVTALRSAYPVCRLCELFDLGTSTYYRHQAAAAHGPAADDDGVRSMVRQIFAEHQGRYGARRITADLQARGLRVNHKRVERFMHLDGLNAERKRPRTTATTDSNHQQSIAENLVARNFSIEELNQVWFTDTTYVATSEGWLYLTCVMDGCSKRIVGWAMSQRNDRFMVRDAFTMAFTRRMTDETLIVHSDRGSTFASKTIRDLLKTHKARPSMSRRADCYDNAVQESFFATMKREMDIRRVIKSIDSTRTDIFTYIETYYNTKRRHSSLGYSSPREYERILLQA